MMDLSSPVQVVLEDAGYETWLMSIEGIRSIGFEDNAVMGFVCLFDDVAALLANWRSLETKLLVRHASSLQKGGDKTWNLYSVFLSSASASETQAREVRWISEDLERTRKLAACGLSSLEQVLTALLPLLPIQSQPLLESADFDLTQRLEKRIVGIAPEGAKAVLNNDVAPADVVRLLGAK